MRADRPALAFCPALLALVLAGAGAATGQEVADPPTVPAPPAAAPAQAETLRVLTLDRERLFSGTRFGQAVIARFEAEAKLLQAENRRIDAALEAEERSLTERRATASPEEFRALAADFDSRVEKLRSAQEAKSRDLSRQRDEARQQFYDTALPVLGKLMTDRGAVAIIDRTALVISFERIDITDEAIARIDEVLGDGGQAPAPVQEAAPPAEPAQGPIPAPTPEAPATTDPAPPTSQP